MGPEVWLLLAMLDFVGWNGGSSRDFSWVNRTCIFFRCRPWVKVGSNNWPSDLCLWQRFVRIVAPERAAG